VSALLILENGNKNEKMKQIRQLGKEIGIVSMLVHKSWYTVAHALRCTHHCILSVGWKMRVGMLLLTWMFSDCTFYLYIAW